MLNALHIENFRGFRSFDLKSLERVNLIVGANDVGKTALLEALFLLYGETNLTLLLKLHAWRGLEKYQGDPDAITAWLWNPLFYHMETGRTIVIAGLDDNDQERSVEIDLGPRSAGEVAVTDEGPTENESPRLQSTTRLQVRYIGAGESHTANMLFDGRNFSVRPLRLPSASRVWFLAARGKNPHEEDASLLGELSVRKEETDLVQILQIIEPRIRKIISHAGTGGPLVYGDIGLETLLPVAFLGDGVCRVLSIVLRMASSRHGTLLIDEIENGIHYSVLEKVWTAIAVAARQFDVQLFATSHSWECIRAAHNALSASPVYDFRLHRLDRVNGDIRSVTYGKRQLEAAITTGLEVR